MEILLTILCLAGGLSGTVLIILTLLRGKIDAFTPLYIITGLISIATLIVRFTKLQ